MSPNTPRVVFTLTPGIYRWNLRDVVEKAGKGRGREREREALGGGKQNQLRIEPNG